MSKLDFNREDYIGIKNLIYIQAFNNYIRDKFKMPMKPPKRAGLIAWDEGMPVIYIHKNYYDDFMKWTATDDNLHKSKEDFITKTNEAIDEAFEEAGLKDGEE